MHGASAPALSSPSSSTAPTSASTKPSAAAEKTDIAFREAYDAHFASLWRLCVRLGIPTRHADDVVHDAFVVAYEKRNSYDASRPLRPWLAGIALRVCAGWRKKHDHKATLDDDTIAMTADPRAPHQTAAAHRIVHEALARMSIDHRTVVTLCDLEGYAAAEVAHMLDVPTGTVYSRLHHARAEFTALVRATMEAP